jgi:hypothetical protein
MVSQGRQHAALTRPNPSATRATFAAAASTTAKYQYVWDQRYIDSPVLRDEDLDSDGDCTDDEGTGSERLCYANDANFNVTALIDTDGAVTERTIYDAYGQPTLYNATWSTTIAESASKGRATFYDQYRYVATTKGIVKQDAEKHYAEVNHWIEGNRWWTPRFGRNVHSGRWHEAKYSEADEKARKRLGLDEVVDDMTDELLESVRQVLMICER